MLSTDFFCRQSPCSIQEVFAQIEYAVKFCVLKLEAGGQELAATMTLHINGEKRDFPDGLTVAALVAQLGMKPDRVAVELNLEIVPRTQWDTIALKNGDKLEVVHFVGGGSSALSKP